MHRDDANIVDDYPESGDEEDPMGLLGWPAADKLREKERASMVSDRGLMHMLCFCLPQAAQRTVLSTSSVLLPGHR